MRARDIKPGFFKNDVLAECSPFARLLFIGLWMYADREGRLECRPRKIKAEILPYDDVDVEALLRELEDGGFVVTYRAGGMRCLWIPTFLKHQRPHQNEAGSVLPAYEGGSPETHGEEEIQPRCEGLATKEQSPCHQGETDVQPGDKALRPSSLTPSSLTPSSLTPHTPPYPPQGGSAPAPEPECPSQGGSSTARAAVSGTADGSSTLPRPARPKKAKTTLARPGDFDAFWEIYPRKTDKEGARKAWDKAAKSGELPDQKVLLAAITWQRSWWRERGTEDEHIPHASTWLNRKRWEDEQPRPTIRASPLAAPLQARRPTAEEVAAENTRINLRRAVQRMREEAERGESA